MTERHDWNGEAHFRIGYKPGAKETPKNLQGRTHQRLLANENVYLKEKAILSIYAFTFLD